MGTKEKDQLVYIKEFKKSSQKAYFVTEDGEIGYKGRVSDILPEILKKIKFDYCLNCGPEPMIKKTIEIEKNIWI